MKMVICSVRDAKADAFGRPLFVQSVGIAIRSFTDEVNRESADNDMYKHSSDFALYELGSFEDSTGEINALSIPKLLVQGDQVSTRHEMKISKV